jgi:hypothetical protein
MRKFYWLAFVRNDGTTSLGRSWSRLDQARKALKRCSKDGYTEVRLMNNRCEVVDVVKAND